MQVELLYHTPGFRARHCHGGASVLCPRRRIRTHGDHASRKNSERALYHYEERSFFDA